MEHNPTLREHLARATGEPPRPAVAAVVQALADTAIRIADRVALGGLAGELGAALGRNADGDVQKALDVEANRAFRDALRESRVALFASEEADDAEVLDPNGTLCVALDPVDGSGNIDTNTPLGTIFSVLPAPAGAVARARSGAAFTWPGGAEQQAAGFFTYGPQTSLVLTTGGGVDLFTLDRRTGDFRLARASLRVPADGPDEYAVNASNYRHWEEPVRAFVDECLAGADGPHGRNFNMRWHGALVAEAYRILMRGGIYLYPADARSGHHEGRLRLVYEAFPIALLMEAAGGAASNGRLRILDIPATSIHQHVPLIAGSRAKVERLEALHHRPSIWPQTAAPLFTRRGLFRV